MEGENINQRNIPKLDTNLLEELEVAFLEFSEEKGFPDAYCTKVSRRLADALGLSYTEGNFKLDLPNEKGELSPTHAWCEDADKTIIDLTAHQFNAFLKEPLSTSVQIIRPDSPHYKRYSPLNPVKK